MHYKLLKIIFFINVFSPIVGMKPRDSAPEYKEIFSLKNQFFINTAEDKKSTEKFDAIQVKMADQGPTNAGYYALPSANLLYQACTTTKQKFLEQLNLPAIFSALIGTESKKGPWRRTIEEYRKWDNDTESLDTFEIEHLINNQPSLRLLKNNSCIIIDDLQPIKNQGLHGLNLSAAPHLQNLNNFMNTLYDTPEKECIQSFIIGNIHGNYEGRSAGGHYIPAVIVKEKDNHSKPLLIIANSLNNEQTLSLSYITDFIFILSQPRKVKNSSSITAQEKIKEIHIKNKSQGLQNYSCPCSFMAQKRIKELREKNKVQGLTDALPRSKTAKT